MFSLVVICCCTLQVSTKVRLCSRAEPPYFLSKLEFSTISQLILFKDWCDLAKSSLQPKIKTPHPATAAGMVLDEIWLDWDRYVWYVPIDAGPLQFNIRAVPVKVKHQSLAARCVTLTDRLREPVRHPFSFVLD
jgi:hypothetical protein